jgi:hypothetical protein
MSEQQEATTTIIEPEEVEAALVDCLYRPEEIDGDNVPDGVVAVEGITSKYGFHPERLEGHRTQVAGWLSLLPKQFREEEGGGWSFLNACNQEGGTQWTGLHQRMEQLFCLGMGLGLVECQLPREVWPSLPGGVPYYAIRKPAAS